MHDLDIKLKAGLITVIFAVFIALAALNALTNHPHVDEGLFADPAYNLAQNGRLGTTALEIEGARLEGIRNRTYWVMPLFLLNAAAFFKTFGFSLFTLRMVSIFWGAVALAAWFVIVRQLFRNELLALLTIALLALNYQFINGASFGRMDMMCAALGFSALGAYLGLREQNLKLALLISHALVVLAGLTHPQGLLSFFGLLFLIFYFDRANLKVRHFAFAVAPYLLGGAAFGLWILQDPVAWREQFVTNATMGGRMSGWRNPLSAFSREFTVRYPTAFGLERLEVSAHAGPAFLKSLILVGYIVGLVGSLMVSKIRQQKNVSVLFALTIIYFVLLALLDGQKLAVYLIQLVPFYTLFLALFVSYIWQRRILPRALVIVALAGFVVLQISGMLFKIRENTYSNLYQPMIAVLTDNIDQQSRVMGSSALGFGLKFSDRLLDDARFGQKTGKRADYIVVTEENMVGLAAAKVADPEIYEYVTRLLNDEYKLIYENRAYKVYARQ